MVPLSLPLDRPKTRVEALRQAEDRTSRAEFETARQKHQALNNLAGEPNPSGTDELRKDPTMAQLLDSLEAEQDIGYYGRLVFSMVARHFLSQIQIDAYLNPEAPAAAPRPIAVVPRRPAAAASPERILKWRRKQAVPVLPQRKLPYSISDPTRNYSEHPINATA
jgi:hypothetical protein